MNYLLFSAEYCPLCLFIYKAPFVDINKHGVNVTNISPYNALLNVIEDWRHYQGPEAVKMKNHERAVIASEYSKQDVAIYGTLCECCMVN